MYFIQPLFRLCLTGRRRPSDNINKFYTVYLAEHFNVLWKENWTLEAERVLKAFEKDVIKKVVCIKCNNL